MEEIARWDGLDLGQCYGYSDSASDLPMLEPSATRSPSTPTPSSPATPGPRLAGGALQPAHEVGDPPLVHRRRRHGDRRRQLRRRRDGTPRRVA